MEDWFLTNELPSLNKEFAYLLTYSILLFRLFQQQDRNTADPGAYSPPMDLSPTVS